MQPGPARQAQATSPQGVQAANPQAGHQGVAQGVGGRLPQLPGEPQGYPETEGVVADLAPGVAPPSLVQGQHWGPGADGRLASRAAGV
jgi:hypothetical protein